jgi:hypothetical protein
VFALYPVDPKYVAVAGEAVHWYRNASKFPPSRVLSGCSST